MQISFTEKKNIRKSFGKLKESLSIPNLIEVQKNSYNELTDFKNTTFSNNPNDSLKTGFQDVDEDLIKSEDL